MKQILSCFLCETIKRCSSTFTTLCASTNGTVQCPIVSHCQQVLRSETRSKHWHPCRPRPRHPKHGTRHNNCWRTLALSTTSLLPSTSTAQPQPFSTTRSTNPFLSSLSCSHHPVRVRASNSLLHATALTSASVKQTRHGSFHQLLFFF